MEIEVNNEITLDDRHDTDPNDSLNSAYATITVGGHRATVKINALIKALEAMRERE